MSPGVHLIGSWLVASATTNNPRDRKLVTLAGVLPDADGLGIIPDVVGSWISGKDCTFHYYQTYHHLLLHGWPGAIAISVLLTFFARQRWRVFLVVLVDLSSASAVRHCWFARAVAGRFVAHLLFRAALPASHLVLETSMETGRVAEPDHFRHNLHDCIVAGGKKRLFFCRDHQLAARFCLRKSASKVASNSPGQNQRRPGPVRFQPDFERNRRSHAQFIGNPFGIWRRKE